MISGAVSKPHKIARLRNISMLAVQQATAPQRLARDVVFEALGGRVEMELRQFGMRFIARGWNLDVRRMATMELSARAVIVRPYVPSG